MSQDPEAAGRIVAGFFAAAAAAPAPMAFELTGDVGNPVANAIQMLPIVLLFGFPIALVHVAVIAVPAYLLLSRRWRVRWWSAALGGLATGSAPALLLFGDAGSAATMGLCGLIGGLVFWAVIRPGGRGRGRDDDDRVFA